jgi:hypothetical protein
MQLDRLSARKHDNVARLSGISVNRFAERSRDCKVFARGTRLDAEMLVSALSAKLKCLRNLHFVEGNHPNDSKFEELPLGVVDRTLELELPDDRRILGALVLPCATLEPCLELEGRVGEVLRWRRTALFGTGLAGCLAAAVGDVVGDSDCASCTCFGAELAEGHGVEGEGGAFADRRRRLSMSSRTMLMSRSARSSTPARFTVRLRRFSANRSQP